MSGLSTLREAVEYFYSTCGPTTTYNQPPPVYKSTLPTPRPNNDPEEERRAPPQIKPSRPPPLVVRNEGAGPPTSREGESNQSSNAPTANASQPYIPSRSSAANLEAMLGSSLALEINSVDHQHHLQKQQLLGQQRPPQEGGKARGDGLRMPSVVETQAMIRAQSADNQSPPGFPQYFASSPGASPIAIPSDTPNSHAMHRSEANDQQPSLAHSYPPTASSSAYMAPPPAVTDERYGASPRAVDMMMTERMMVAANKAAAAAVSGNGTSNSSSSSVANSQRSLFQTAAGVELVQFLLETESRAMILFNVESLSSEVLRSACEKLGSLVYIRFENKVNKGVVFLAYHDLRAALRAFHTLPRELSQLTDQPVVAHYSIMLNAANSPRDGILLVKDVQASVTESDVHAVFSAYGQLKNVHRRISNQYNNGMTEFFLVEYYDIQDAKLAAYELSTSTPWGRNIVVEEAERPEKERALGQQLVLTLRRWCREEQCSSYSSLSSRSGGDDCNMGSSPCSSPNITPPQVMYIKPHFSNAGTAALSPPLLAFPARAPHHYGITAAGCAAQPAAAAYYTVDPNSLAAEEGLCNGLHNMWVTSPHGGAPGSPASGKRSPTGAYFPRRGMKREVCLGVNGVAEAEYQLDLDKVLRGLDKRTTIMIRNIPNKYTQQLLLAEINEGNKGKYDFFYLPIDFKNKCNVGYAFINFIDYRSIAAFFREFNGQRWKNFNSEKVCSLTYARIQGKHSMITRFQNSSLMEKDWEYRPLLFHSSGVERGKPEPFPVGPKQSRRLSQPMQQQVAISPCTLLPPGFSPVAVWATANPNPNAPTPGF